MNKKNKLIKFLLNNQIRISGFVFVLLMIIFGISIILLDINDRKQSNITPIENTNTEEENTNTEEENTKPQHSKLKYLLLLRSQKYSFK